MAHARRLVDAVIGPSSARAVGQRPLSHLARLSDEEEEL